MQEMRRSGHFAKMTRISVKRTSRDYLNGRYDRSVRIRLTIARYTVSTEEYRTLTGEIP